MERSAWPAILVVALLLSGVGPAPCAAQPPSGVQRPAVSQPPPAARPATAEAPPSPVQPPALPMPNPAGRAQPAPPPGQPPLVRSLTPIQPDRAAEPLDKVVTLRSAPLEPTDLRFPINLATALAALRRPAADRGRRAGQRLGGRGAAHAGQGPLGPHAQHRLRLYPARRRRPGLQQGHHDRAERELLLRRWRR